MSLLKKLSARLFKSKHTQKVPRKPSDQLEKMPLEELMAVIQNSKDEQLRNSAVQKIDQLSNLLTLADIHSGKTTVSHLQKSAKKRIAQLLDANEISRTEFCKSVEDPIQRFAILGLMADQTIADRDVAAITDEALLTRIVLEATSSRIRQAAAERIQAPEHLFLLLKECKNTDKSVFKIIKEKCDHIKTLEKKQQLLIAEQLQLVNSLEQHARHVYDNYYSAKLTYLDQQWKALTASTHETISEEILARAQTALHICLEKDNLHRAEIEAEENLKNALAHANQQRDSLIDRLDQLLVALVQGTATDDEIATQQSAWKIDWKALVQLKEPAKTFSENIERELHAIESETKSRAEFGTLKEHSYKLEMQLNLQSHEAENYFQSLHERVKLLRPFMPLIPDALSLADVAFQQFNEKKKCEEDEAQVKLRQFGGLIRKTKEAIESGELGKASGFRHTLEEKKSQFVTLPTHFVHQLERVDEAIAKLKDWKSYAVAPKKLEIIAQMESLISASLHPEVRAEKVKRLQDEWKQLSKGMSDQEQWEKFRELAQQAYAPCQVYFAEQAALRAANLEECKKLVQQLNDYLHLLKRSAESERASAFDWRVAEQVIRVARQEWRNYTPTERVATQPVLAQFDQLIEEIHQKIIQEQARIAAQKQQVIDRAQQLVQAEDMRKAIDSIKALQVEWQNLGVCGHKQEQQLWQAFRQTCDQVFAKRQQQSAEFKAELDANHETAKQLMSQLTKIQQLEGKAFLDARTQVDDIRKAFSAIGQLPKVVANELSVQFQRAFHDFDEKISLERAKEKQQIWINLFGAAEKINHYELGLVHDLPLANQKEELQAYLQQLSPLPTGGLKSLQQKLDRANAETSLETNASSLRHLCVSSEILMELQTPSEDIKLRQAIQVEQLQQNFGKKIHNLRAEMESRVFEWLQIGAVEQTFYQKLAERFNQCLLKAIKSAGTSNK